MGEKKEKAQSLGFVFIWETSRSLTSIYSRGQANNTRQT